MEVKVKLELKKTVEEKAKQGVCLVCGQKSYRRGLCARHYMQFHRKRLEQPKSKRAEFEVKRIYLGMILPSGQIRELQNPNAFEVED
jgi:hypothetical protein